MRKPRHKSCATSGTPEGCTQTDARVLREANHALARRVEELECALVGLVPFMQMAFDAEGDTFGVSHNAANDALIAAERMTRTI